MRRDFQSPGWFQGPCWLSQNVSLALMTVRRVVSNFELGLTRKSYPGLHVCVNVVHESLR